MNWFNQFFFGFYPYLCMVAYFLGAWARFDRSQFTWRSQSSQFLRRRYLFWGSNLFHVGIIGLFFGHLFGLLTPPEVYHAMGLSVKGKQLLAIVVGGVFATACFIGATMLIYRRVTDSRIYETSKRTDLFIILFIYVQLIIGIAGIPVSFMNIEGTYMLVMAEWSRSIFLFQPGAAALLENVPWIYKIHLIFGMTLFLITPFTRLIHIFSAPIWMLGRPGWQIVRRNRNISKQGV
ncbi:MAG: respiratory nitrate reductase subunit gamma [Hyphomicrobiaceae bacterium]|nr:respiratory nitrate reductase subunit gamma [Hyphomicrobiaceae bacterium]